MLIREITEPTAAAQPAAAQQQEPEPTPQDIADVQGLIGSIDPQKEQPQTLLGKLTGWIKQYPILDKVTDIIPQTRLVKAIANAVDAIEAGDNAQALNALAGAVGGGIAQAARAVNVGTALSAGNIGQAALAAGGNVAKAAKVAQAGQNLAQGDVTGAVSSLNPTAGRVATVAQQQLKPTEDLDRIRQLAGR